MRGWIDASNGDHGEMAGLLLLDFSNAFNACSRAEILKAIYADVRLKPLWGIAHFTLGSPSKVRMYARDGKLFHECLSR